MSNIDPTKEELMHALEEEPASVKEHILSNIRYEREKAEEKAKTDKHAEMEKTLCARLDAEQIKFTGDMSGAHYIDGFGVIITIENIQSEVSSGLVYAVGYYNTDMDHTVEGEPLKMRLTDTIDDVISWAIEATTCPFCHSRQLEDTPNGPEIVCANCGNSWR